MHVSSVMLVFREYGSPRRFSIPNIAMDAVWQFYGGSYNVRRSLLEPVSLASYPAVQRCTCIRWCGPVVDTNRETEDGLESDLHNSYTWYSCTRAQCLKIILNRIVELRKGNLFENRVFLYNYVFKCYI